MTTRSEPRAAPRRGADQLSRHAERRREPRLVLRNGREKRRGYQVWPAACGASTPRRRRQAPARGQGCLQPRRRGRAMKIAASRADSIGAPVVQDGLPVVWIGRRRHYPFSRILDRMSLRVPSARAMVQAAAPNTSRFATTTGRRADQQAVDDPHQRADHLHALQRCRPGAEIRADEHRRRRPAQIFNRAIASRLRRTASPAIARVARR